MVLKPDLILITNNYPHVTGDRPFVESEIGALAREFRNVQVVTAHPSPDPLVDHMPHNVQFAGSLTGVGPRLTILKSLHPRYVRRLARLILGELRDRRERVQFARLFRCAATAVLGGDRLRHLVHTASESGHPVVVYSFWGTDGGLAVIEVGTAATFRAVRMHGYDLYEERVGYLPLRGRLFATTDILLTVSAHGATYLETNFSHKYTLPPVRVARLGTYDQGVRPSAPSDVVRIVSCSSMIALKRLDKLLDVVDRLAEDCQVEWVHIGDGPMRSVLESRANRKMRDNLSIEFLGDVDHPDVLEFYATQPVSAFVNLSTHEGLPMAIMEALSFDIPVLATDVGGSGELVGEEAGSGILVSVEASVEDVTEELKRLVDNSHAWQPRKVWLAKCNAERNSDAVATLLARGGQST